MPTNISWAKETLNPIIARTWWCPLCKWTGIPLESGKGGDYCGNCHAQGVLVTRRGWHCERVSPGCGGGCASPEYAELLQIGERDAEAKGGCYAESMNESIRWGRGTGLPYTRGSRDKVEISLNEKALTQPLRWQAPRTIFWASMTDWAAEFVLDEWMDKMVAVAALTPQHKHLLLTKRADRVASYALGEGHIQRVNNTGLEPLTGVGARRSDIRCEIVSLGGQKGYNRIEGLLWPPPNVWLGFSAENQQCFDERWGEMAPLAAEGWNVWCSAEPLLGPIDASVQHQLNSGANYCVTCRGSREITDPAHPMHPSQTGDGDDQNWCLDCDTGGRELPTVVPGLEYIVIGGESGTGYRALKLEWLTDLADQCKQAGIPTHVKQDSGFYPGKQGRIPDEYWAMKAEVSR